MNAGMEDLLMEERQLGRAVQHEGSMHIPPQLRRNGRRLQRVIAMAQALLPDRIRLTLARALNLPSLPIVPRCESRFGPLVCLLAGGRFGVCALAALVGAGAASGVYACVLALDLAAAAANAGDAGAHLARGLLIVGVIVHVCVARGVMPRTGSVGAVEVRGRGRGRGAGSGRAGSVGIVCGVAQAPAGGRGRRAMRELRVGFGEGLGVRPLGRRCLWGVDD